MLEFHRLQQRFAGDGGTGASGTGLAALAISHSASCMLRSASVKALFASPAIARSAYVARHGTGRRI